MKAKKYECQMPGCSSTVMIRSTIKTGEFKGLKVCQLCKSKIEGVVKPRTKLKPFTTKKKESRSEERKELPDFFNQAIERMKENPICANCGCRINVNFNAHWNVAHILPKQKYKSVMNNEFNWIPLCSSKDIGGKDCHNAFDTNISGIKDMPCFIVAKENFKKFKDSVQERGKIFYIFEEN